WSDGWRGGRGPAGRRTARPPAGSTSSTATRTPWLTCGWTCTRRRWPSSAGSQTRTSRWWPTTSSASEIRMFRQRPSGWPRSAAEAGDEAVWAPYASREHRGRPLEGAGARGHLHRLVEAVGVGGGVTAPAALADHDRVEIHAEGLAHAGLDAAIGGAAADDERGATEQPEQLGRAGAVEGARPALEVDVVLRPRCDLVGEAGVGRTLDAVGEGRHARLGAQIGRQQHAVRAVGPAHRGGIDDGHRERPARGDQGDPGG